MRRREHNGGGIDKIHTLSPTSTRRISTSASYPTSIPPTLTVTRMGNGDIPVAFVMSGTAVRPFSDDVCTSIVCTAFVSVAANVVRNCCRSGKLYWSDKREKREIRTSVRLGLAELSVDYPARENQMGSSLVGGKHVPLFPWNLFLPHIHLKPGLLGSLLGEGDRNLGIAS